tara:strand:+ start:82243 stop:83481 length:1239 start_codon:yes stop_codon:yes gene_type:complete
MMNDTPRDRRQPLTFDSDAGSARSKFIAGGLVLVILAWMGSGLILPSDDGVAPAKKATAAKVVTVAVRPSTAEVVTQVFVAEGQALPDRDTMIRAETGGEVAEVLVKKGADVEAGDVIARLDIATRQSDLTRAEAELSRAQREYDNAEALLSRGVSTVDRVSQARATLAAAEASLATAQQAIQDADIRAPFAGRLETLDIDAGEFVSMGAEVARLVDNTPLTISVQIPQQSLRDVKVGQQASVDFITGAEATGKVQFVSTSASAETRTFEAEITVDNADAAIPAGISAQVRIPTGEVQAHFVSPAILSLGTDGTLGIKTVNEENTVVFNAIGIVRAQTDGIWVSGLPESAQIITIGQGFVNNGEVVNPQPEDAADAPPADEVAAGVPEVDDPSQGTGQIIEQDDIAKSEADK